MKTIHLVVILLVITITLISGAVLGCQPESEMKSSQENLSSFTELRQSLRASDDGLQSLQYDHRLDRSLNNFFNGTGREPGKPGYHRIDLDKYWDTSGFYLPDGAGSFRATSRKAFSYPVCTFYTKLPTMRKDNHYWLGFITEPDGVLSVACFEWIRGQFRAVIGDLAIVHEAELGSFLPADYDTARHRYTIKVNKGTVEFYIDYYLCAVGLFGLLPVGDYVTLSQNQPPYAVFGNFTPLMASHLSAFIEIDTDGGDLLFPINPEDNSFAASDGDPQPPRQYFLYNENTRTLWAEQTVSTKTISHPIPLWGYQGKTLFFQSAGEGTLDIMVYAGRDWRLYKSIPASANRLVMEKIDHDAPLARCEYTPDTRQLINVAEFNLN